jgi:hypothetical protein
MLSDFRRDHSTSPCLSTAIDDRHLPSDERWDRQIFLVPVSFRRECRAQRVARGGGSLSKRTERRKRAAANVSQGRENRSDNFFQFVTEEMHGVNPQFAHRA